jgi:hypothetical protein
MATDGQAPRDDSNDSNVRYPRWSLQDWRTFVITIEAAIIANIVTVIIIGLAIAVAKFVRQHDLLFNPWFWLFEMGLVVGGVLYLASIARWIRDKGRAPRFFRDKGQTYSRNERIHLTMAIISLAYVLVTSLALIGVIAGIK